MLADAQLIAHKPKTLSMREAAALPLVGITAYEGLQRAGAKPGQKILVHGGAGGVGHVAVQLARHFGADVYATGSGEKAMGIIKQYGATPIDYKAENVADYVARSTDGAGFYVVFDSVGGANVTKSFEAAALNGQVTTTVSLLELELTPAHFKGLSLHVVFILIPMLYDHKRDEHGAILAKLAEIADAGALKPLLDETSFGLEAVGKAHDRLTSGPPSLLDSGRRHRLSAGRPDHGHRLVRVVSTTDQGWGGEFRQFAENIDFSSQESVSPWWGTGAFRRRMGFPL